MRTHSHPAYSRLTQGVRGLLVIAAVLIGACASLPTNYPRSASAAFAAHDTTPIGAEIAATAAHHPGQSGFIIIRHGRQAFTARVMLADLAQKSIDVQYFLWEADATGRILADHLIQAADRGVRVRVLIDDVSLKDRDAGIAALDAHPNVEIRLFNPFAHRDSRLLGFLTDFDRVNHRMHNKLMVTDNAMAIVGGRNMSDAYFEVDPAANFRDLDIAALGPVVRDLSNLFDRFWNGDWAVPMAAMVDKKYDEADMRAQVQRTRETIAKGGYPHPLGQDLATMRRELSGYIANAIWARGHVVYDDPASINDPNLRTMNTLLFQRFSRLQTELMVESAYFIPQPRAVEKLKELTDRGVKIRVLTNSLASNDVLSAFAGYAKRREDLLRNGIELYELRPEPGPVHKHVFGSGAKAGLHTKAIVFDRKDVFIGSFNLDPRSSYLNTEAGLYVESPALAEQVIEYMNTGVDPNQSFRVQLGPEGRLFWVTEDDGKAMHYDVEPMSTTGQRFQSWIIRLLPIDSQL